MSSVCHSTQLGRFGVDKHLNRFFYTGDAIYHVGYTKQPENEAPDIRQAPSIAFVDGLDGLDPETTDFPATRFCGSRSVPYVVSIE